MTIELMRNDFDERVRKIIARAANEASRLPELIEQVQASDEIRSMLLKQARCIGTLCEFLAVMQHYYTERQ